MRDDLSRLKDILEAIYQIEKYQPPIFEDLISNELVQIWIIHYIQEIGEASAGMSPGFRLQYPQIPWRQIIDMRNLLVHQYFGVDPHEVWNAVISDLPTLKASIVKIIDEISPSR
ncbi:DUF86 domain-containing protein [uncultured Methanospirillum sp.]|uniref:HepT-like ribonuclease domain-containing protein n=1 Tax=uncultured Methanospirillum sp. TaxID=262503 RepID=UPI0029C88585|nr:DUF86 domain-containing protein [uncultured Methanospirillum sp.]